MMSTFKNIFLLEKIMFLLNLITIMNNEISSGDVVRLKSSNTIMTVECFPVETVAICIWIDEENNKIRNEFPIKTLVKVSEKEIHKFRKDEKNRLDSKFNAGWADKVYKVSSLAGAIGTIAIIIFNIIQTSKIRDIDIKLDKLIEKNKKTYSSSPSIWNFTK